MRSHDSTEGTGVPVEDYITVKAALDGAHSWTSANHGRVALIEAPAGSWKTGAALELLRDLGHGTILFPRYDLRDEAKTRLDHETTDLTSVLGTLRPSLQSRLQPWAERGWSAGAWAKDRDEAGDAVEGDGRIYTGVHQHLLRVSRRDGEYRLDLPGPVILDEQPPLIYRVELPVEELELLTGDYTNWKLNDHCQARARSAAWIVGAGRAAARRYSQARPIDRRYAWYVGGEDLASLLIDQATHEDLVRELSYLVELTGRQGPFASPLRPPSPPLDQVFDGRLLPQQWPCPNADLLLAGGLHEWKASLQLSELRRGHFTLKVTGRAAAPRVDLQWRSAWPCPLGPWHHGIRPDYSFIVLDATAGALVDAYRAAWSEWDLRVFRVRLPHPCPEAVRRVHIKSASAYTRSGLVLRGS